MSLDLRLMQVPLIGCTDCLLYTSVGGIGTELFVGSCQLLLLLINGRDNLLLHRADAFADVGQAAFQGVGGNLRCTFIFIGQKEALKVHGSIDGCLLYTSVEQAAWKVGVAVQDGRMFHGPFHLRMNLALPLSRVKEAFERLDKYVFNAG